MDYRLSADSPLVKDGTLKRIMYRGENYCPELHWELMANGVQPKPVGSALNDRQSLMEIDEYLALLSFPGVVWFVANMLRIEPKAAAVAILSGMPWPLLMKHERTPLLLSVSVHQASFLKQMFRQQEDNFFSLLFGDDDKDDGGYIRRELERRRKRAGYELRVLALKTGQNEKLLRHTAKALRQYLNCLDSYRWKEALSAGQMGKNMA